MGYQAIIYGRIQGAKNPQGDKTNFVHHYNRGVLQKIEDYDDIWPFLTRHMFSAAEETIPWTPDRGLYKSQIIHFGASLKDFATDGLKPHVWIEKFEQILKKLLWATAKVHIETRFHVEQLYLYRVTPDSLWATMDEVQTFGSPIDAHVEWTREILTLPDVNNDWLH